MIDEHTTKTCKVCFSEIDQRAKKCPFCHQWQGRLQAVLVPPNVAGLIATLIMLGLFIPLLVWMGRSVGPGRDVAPYVDQIHVVNSHIEFSEWSEGKPIVEVIGLMRNDSEYSWKDVDIEVRFFDHHDEMFDTANTIGRHGLGRPILPGQEQSFTVTTTRDHPPERYTSHEARVTSALDGRQRF